MPTPFLLLTFIVSVVDFSLLILPLHFALLSNSVIHIIQQNWKYFSNSLMPSNDLLIVSEVFIKISQKNCCRLAHRKSFLLGYLPGGVYISCKNGCKLFLSHKICFVTASLKTSMN